MGFGLNVATFIMCAIVEATLLKDDAVWQAISIYKGWDDKVTDVPLTTITEIIARVCQADPVRGTWCVDGPELDVWVDASSLATGVSLEHDEAPQVIALLFMQMCIYSQLTSITNKF